MGEQKLFYDDVNAGDTGPAINHQLTRTDLVMYAGAVAVPLIIGRALRLSPEQVAVLVNADLFACGVATRLPAPSNTRTAPGDIVTGSLKVSVSCGGASATVALAPGSVSSVSKQRMSLGLLSSGCSSAPTAVTDLNVEPVGQRL